MNLAHVRRLVENDIRRMLRKYTDRSRGVGTLISTAIYGLLVAIATLVAGYGAHWLGASLVSGDLDGIAANAIIVARGVVAIFGLILTVVIAIRAVGQRGTLAIPEGVLTIVPTREALVGVLVAESIFVLIWLAGPVIGVGIGLSLGTGTVWPTVTVPLASGMVAVTGVVIGYPVGLGLRHIVTRFSFVAHHKGLLIALVFILYFAFAITGSLNSAIVTLFEPLQISPTGWFADMLLVGIPAVGASPIRAVGSVAVLSVFSILGVMAGSHFAAIHWFSDPAVAGDTEPETSDEAPEPGIERRLAPYVSVPTATLVTLAWRRAIRAPLKLLYAAYPLFFAIGGVADILQTGDIPAYLPVVTLVFVTWAAGVIFTLNPLGDQGTGLPITLLSRVDGTRFVRAHLIASLLIVVPGGMVVTTLAAILSPIDAISAIFIVAAAPVLMAIASALSIGIGMAFPRFEAVSITRSVKTVIPSLLAFALFSLHLVATTVSAFIVYDEGIRSVTVTLMNWVLPIWFSIDSTMLYVFTGLLLVGLALLPIASYRYAVTRFDTYTLS